MTFNLLLLLLTVGAAPASATLIVGDAGVDVLNLSSGTTNDVNLIVGNQSAGNGTINLTGGTINLTHDGSAGGSGVATIGNAGTGLVNHGNVSGPAVVNIGVGAPPFNSVNAAGTPYGGYLLLGKNDGGNGRYVMTDAHNGNSLVLNIGNEIQIGGSNIPGVQSCTSGQTCRGSFEQNGGTVNVGAGVNFSGKVTIGIGSGTGSYKITGGVLNVPLELNIGNTSTGNSFTQSGGTVNAPLMKIGDGTNLFGQSGTSTYTLSGGVLHTDNFAWVGVGGNANIVNSGGVHTIKDGEMILGIGYGNSVYGNGTYVASGTGVVEANRILIASVGTGLMRQTDSSSVNVNQLIIGGGDISRCGFPVPCRGHGGSYELFGGTLGVATDGSLPAGSGGLVVGNYGVGSFVQSGGKLSAGNNDPAAMQFVIGAQSGSVGTFEQSGGEVIVNRLMVIGQAGGAAGTYNLKPGTNPTLNVNGAITLGFLGTGTFSQSGGASTVTGNISVADQAGSTGTYNLSGGTLSAASMSINSHGIAAGTLNYSGGSLTLGNGIGTATNNVGGTVNFSGPGMRVVDGNLTNSGTTNLTTNAQVNVLNQTGGTINLNANNFNVIRDYTNTSFGTGNSFNARAGVTGSGLIVGVNASQAVTGAVTLTEANTYTLNLNVRAGTSTTVNYQIANNGTGADIRGAIQTGGPGLGSITDARLSGTGVPAGGVNFGPIAAGGSTGNFAVTLNGSAGSGSLVGQSIAVVSNFGNVAPQIINLTGTATALAQGSATPSTDPVNLGNFRVDSTASQNFAVTNTTSAAGAERLGIATATTTGNFGATNNLGGGFVAPGVTQANAVTASVAGGTAGVNNGSLQIRYTTNGQLIDPTFTTIDANSQTINLTATGFVAAQRQLNTTNPFNFGTVQVGQNVQQTLSISNVASGPAGFVEDLGASFGASSGVGASKISGTGSIGSLVAGGTNASSMVVHVDTSSAATINGAIAVNYFTNGTVNGVSNGLGVASAGTDQFGVIGSIAANVVDQAKPVINGIANPNAVTVNLGNVRIGTAANQTLTVQNQATGNQQAALNASIASNGAPITASGSFNQLLPGNSSPGQAGIGTLQVGISAAAPAGHAAGSATVSLVSDASNIGGCAPNCAMNLPSQTVNVSADVYRLANPVINTSSPVNLAGRVGGVGDSTHLTSAISISNSSPDQFTEGLNVTRGSTPSGFTSSGGPIVNLAAGQTSTAIQVALNTTTAGHVGGTQVLQFASNGTITGNSDLALANGSVTLSGNVYTPAVAQLSSASINFGIVHVGDVVPSMNVTVKNDAAVTALNDTLQMAFASASAPFSGSGTLVNLAAQQSDSTSLSVGLNTATAGVYSGQATFSAASHDSELADLALANVNVALQGQVNNYALAAMRENAGGGTFSGGGTSYVLDFGNLFQNSGHRLANLGAFNNVLGPADLLSGAFQFLDAMDFGETGFGPFSGLAAGQSDDLLNIDFNTALLGFFQDQIRLTWSGSNASGYQGPNNFILLTLRANVIQPSAVPEPATLWLMLLCLTALAYTASRRARPVQY